MDLPVAMKLQRATEGVRSYESMRVHLGGFRLADRNPATALRTGPQPVEGVWGT